MPRAFLRFSLPLEETELNYAVKGIDYHSCLEDVQVYLSQQLEYTDSYEKKKLLEEVQKEFKEILESRDVILFKD